MKWTEKAWESIVPLYDKIVTMPFLKELMDGTLDREKFEFYIQQDALYLVDYGKVLSGIASKLNKPEHIEAFVHFSGDAMAVEKALHSSFMQDFNIDDAAEQTPSCLLYTSYLLRHLANSPVELILAAVLPCFWVYQEVGNYIFKHQTKDNNPYQAWIDTYGGEEFEKSVTLAISITDQIAEKCTKEQQEAMMEAFILSTKMEWIFWDSAYKLEEWSI